MRFKREMSAAQANYRSSLLANVQNSNATLSSPAVCHAGAGERRAGLEVTSWERSGSRGTAKHVMDVVAKVVLLIPQSLFHRVALCYHGMWDAVCRLRLALGAQQTSFCVGDPTPENENA